MTGLCDFSDNSFNDCSDKSFNDCSDNNLSDFSKYSVLLSFSLMSKI